MSAPQRAGVFIIGSNARSPERDDSDRSPSAESPSERSSLLWHPSGADEEPEPSFSPLSLVVRSARLTDIVSLARVPAVLRLNQPEINLIAYRPARLAARPLQRWRQNGPHLFVACAGDRLVGFAHWQPVLPDRRWQLIALGSSTGVYDAGPVWEELVRHATKLLVMRELPLLELVRDGGEGILPLPDGERPGEGADPAHEHERAGDAGESSHHPSNASASPSGARRSPARRRSAASGPGGRSRSSG